MVRFHAVALMLVVACASSGPGGEQTHACLGDALLAPGRAGAIVVGMPIDSVASVCPIARRVVSPEYEAEILFIPVEADTLRVWTRASRVDWIDVSSPRYRTADSLGVAESGLRLLRLPDLGGGPGDGNDIYVLHSRAKQVCGLSFVMDRQSSESLAGTKNIRDDLAALRPEPTIVAVWVGGPSNCMGG